MKSPYAIGSVPSLSGHAIAYRWRSLPRVRRHRASKPHGSSERVLPWQITMDQLIFASLSHTHYWYEITRSSKRFATVRNKLMDRFSPILSDSLRFSPIFDCSSRIGGLSDSWFHSHFNNICLLCKKKNFQMSRLCGEYKFFRYAACVCLCAFSSHLFCCCCCCCLHIKNRSDLYPVPFSFLLFKAKKRISVVTS